MAAAASPAEQTDTVPQSPHDIERGSEDEDDALRPRRYDTEWYANWFEVDHNALQFKIDCARTLTDDGEVLTMFIRVTSDALRARQLFQLLGAELIAFMDVHGPIVAEPTRGDTP
jgi:hypothetical protein